MFPESDRCNFGDRFDAHFTDPRYCWRDEIECGSRRMMSFLLKSAVGLGAVYFAMFSPEPKSGELGSKETLCAIATRAETLGGDLWAYRAQLAAAGCVVSLGEAAKRLAASLAAPAAATPPPAAPPPPPAQNKPALGSLTADDLRDPWFGPDPHAHKPRNRA
jgi:hypothetical protein